MTTVLSIDQGTSGTKAVVVEASGRVLSLAEIAVTPSYLSGGGVEHDPLALLESVLTAGRQAVEQAGVEIHVVTLANQGESVLAWDLGTGEPLSPIIVWQDRRSQPICTELASQADIVQERTGLRLESYFSAPKQTWIRRNITREGVVTTTDSWILHQLTGEFVTDVTTASRSLVFDIHSRQWDPELLGLFDLQDEKMPRIAANDEIVGQTSAFGGQVPVGGIVVDQQAALVAEHCVETGEAKCTFGTGAFLLANVGEDPVVSKSGLSTSVAWSVRDRAVNCLDGQVYTAASAVRWLEKLTFIDSAADLDTVAADDAGDVMCVPALAGLAAPWWRPDATAKFTGITLSTGAEHMVRAVLEGIAAQVATLAQAMMVDLGQGISRLRVDGGLTQSRVLMQVVSDLMQIPVDVYPSQHATPLGAAALARMALDPKTSLDEAIVDWEPTTVYEPRWSPERAVEYLSRWHHLAQPLRRPRQHWD